MDTVVDDFVVLEEPAAAIDTIMETVEESKEGFTHEPCDTKMAYALLNPKMCLAWAHTFFGGHQPHWCGQARAFGTPSMVPLPSVP